jgi:hypothetical protein
MEENQTIQSNKFIIRKNRKPIYQNLLQNKTTSISSKFSIEPKIIKFVGFEVGTTKIKKFKIINISGNLQRLVILPMISDNFSFYFDKKGDIASGMFETVKVSFVSKDYNVYKTQIRILNENEVFVVPIIAYPVINPNIKNIFPSFIDFEIRKINEVHKIVKRIECTIPLSFKFEFKIKKNNQNLKIEPLRGVISGNNFVNINIIFTPKQSCTLFLEAEVF